MLTDPFQTNRITSTIIGRAIRVHRATGPGLLESAYSPCLVLELHEAGLSVRAPDKFQRTRAEEWCEANS